ncbi:BsuPI-related putative proteinase inhibitor [Bacillus salacetis]|uniref:BsuPI-related putative proteinase inhibitor n=1 Tax=Bacillus salacetis TaxID=2315464 RepID=UPI003B9FCA9A
MARWLITFIALASLISWVVITLQNDQTIEDNETSKEVSSNITNNSENETNGDTGKDQEAGEENMRQGVYSTLNKAEGSEGLNEFVYTVHNNTDKDLILKFRTSQRYDYILKKNGKVVEQYSKDKAFMQVMSEQVVSPGETYSTDLSFPALTPGSYSLEVWLTTETKGDFVKTIDFEVDTDSLSF